MTLHKSIATLLITSLLGAVPVTAGELRQSAERHAAAMSAQSGALSPVAGVNPNKKKALILAGLGGATMAIGLLRTVPKDCVNTSFGAYCGAGADTKLIVAGAAVAGAGGVLYLVGEKKKASIGISFVPDGVAVQQRMRF